MIFNWRNNCIKILQNNEYSHNDRWEIKEEYRQQIWLVAYLIRLGWDKEKIYNKWKTIPTFKLSASEGLHPEELEVYFDSLYSKGMITSGAPSFKKMNNVRLTIFQEEIDAINSIVTSYEFRKYLLMLLAVYKYYTFTRGSCYFDSKVRGYAFESSNLDKKYGNYSEALINLNKEAGCPIQSKIVRQFHVSHLSFVATTGTPAIEFEDPGEIIKHLDVIELPVMTCSICGRPFTYTTKTKRNVCDECYQTQRNEYEKLRKRLSSQRARNKRKHFASGELIADELSNFYFEHQITQLELPTLPVEPWDKVAQEYPHTI